MTEIAKIFNVLKKSGLEIFGPSVREEETHVLELSGMPDEKLLAGVSDRPWKYFFMPEREMLYECEKGKPVAPKEKISQKALFGMSFFDCKAIELYDAVFAGDAYYAERRKNIFIVGYSAVPVSKIDTIFFEPNLESAIFDIFIEAGNFYARGNASSPSSRTKQPQGTEMRDLVFYARGKRAEKILKSCGIKYTVLTYKKNIEDKKVAAIKKAVLESKDDKIWEELGDICLACGKCTIACPTCYCFDMESSVGPECKTDRCSGNCFYDDFTRIAGGHKFLNSPAEKIFFWYYHKFVRIPFGYNLPGCVDCGRCTAVCPVGIDIEKNINRLLKEANVKNQKSNVKTNVPRKRGV